MRGVSVAMSPQQHPRDSDEYLLDDGGGCPHPCQVSVDAPIRSRHAHHFNWLSLKLIK